MAVKHEDPEIGTFPALATYYSYAILILFGHIRDFLGKLFNSSRYIEKKPKSGYSVLLKSWESFYTRRLYHRIQDCWNRPICSSPGATIDVMERVSKDNNCTLVTSGKSTRCVNVGSYNYLGYADDWKETCATDVFECLESWPASMCSARMDFGTTSLLEELEETVARYIGKEAALVTPMGYNTNVVTLRALMGEGTLIVSDNLNHTSLVNGARGSSAQIRVFRSNDIPHLEEVLQEAIVKGQPRHHRPWKKIMVVVEGIYSMEGAICKLKEIVEVVKRFKCYIYVDEAHSIGALGQTGRGVCEYAGVDPKDIDILMGTFTKSFSGMGGYICADKKIIEYLRATSEGILYHNAMSPIVTQQVISAFKVIMGEDGTDIGQRKINSLRENSNYFRDKLMAMGLHVYGDHDSPIIPVMIYMPCKIAAFSRECLKRGLAVVVVGFPATPLVLSRARFCISAGHTRADLDKALVIVEEVVDLMMMKYGNSPIG
jgi:serine palmitoyltransferase